MKNVIYKVPDGKLLKMRIGTDESGCVKFFELRGDFFVYPEDGFLLVEKFLFGKLLTEDLFEDLDEFIKVEELEIYGFKAKDLKEALL